MYAWAAAGLKLPGEVPNKHELGILKLQDGLCLVPGGGQLSLTLCPNPYVSEAAVSGERELWPPPVCRFVYIGARSRSPPARTRMSVRPRCQVSESCGSLLYVGMYI